MQPSSRKRERRARVLITHRRITAQGDNLTGVNIAWPASVPRTSKSLTLQNLTAI